MFWPPFLLLSLAVVFSVFDVNALLRTMTAINGWILINFDWLFSYTTFSLVISLLVVYFSPLGRIRIGGEEAEPLLSKWQWFSITLCTTVATGILFWAAAEPLFHSYSPPTSLDILPNTDAARRFSMATLFMHWSFSPYAIYTVPALVFALCYYNLNYDFTIGTPLRPVLGQWTESNSAYFIDAVALFALVAGMSASMGTGILILSGGISAQIGMENSKALMALVAFLIIISFVLSAVSGLHKGMARLSSLNIHVFFCLAAFVVIAGPSAYLLTYGLEGVSEYGQSFLIRSLNLLTAPEDNWTRSWTVFYFANWYAWAPITALFLGRIARGYTVRQFIITNFVWPSCCAIVWLSIFSGATLQIDLVNGGNLQKILVSQGPESVVFALFDYLPFAAVMTLFLILITFISYVTAADSNTDAMSRLCTHTTEDDNGQSEQTDHSASLLLKFIWGATVGVVAWTMVSYASIDGIKMMSNLGGLPALFIILTTNVSLFILLKRVLRTGALH